MSKRKIHIQPWNPDGHHVRCWPNKYIKDVAWKHPPVSLDDMCKNCHKSVMDEGWKFENGHYYYWGHQNTWVTTTLATTAANTTTLGYRPTTYASFATPTTFTYTTYADDDMGWVRY